MSSDCEYFKSYEDISVHELMLSDKPRTLAYMHFMQQNASLFENKIVMDVGAGTGILSLFAAKFGKAKRVYAVEASSMALVARRIMEQNKMQDVVKVVHCAVEDLATVEQGEALQVDVIISEWMGFYLVHESMLASVLFARDKFLKKGGFVFPNKARIYAAPCDMSPQLDQIMCTWQDTYGFDFSPVADMIVKDTISKPLITVLDKGQLLSSNVHMINELNLQTIEPQGIRTIVAQESFHMDVRDSAMHGICLWFDVVFDGPSSTIVLGTGPMDDSTHWKQTVIFLPQPVQVIKGSLLPLCSIILQVNPDTLTSSRQYTISVEFAGRDDQIMQNDPEQEKLCLDDDEEVDNDEEEEEHDEDHCECLKCKLIRACYEMYDQQQQQEPEEQ